eukprot:gnl/Dysnectes_brevis/2634_a3185_1445.p1 GENE.gnl/Dysnectes_brevis/2634_a3185_1445~~gnl/Dysnectes_brevis/2634_a3185_1445.p1  ORF type:complete len:284 (+),score=19.43 gnl/Dysnectes_brevis/2634_a3185_1445:114-965(+)
MDSFDDLLVFNYSNVMHNQSHTIYRLLKSISDHSGISSITMRGFNSFIHLLILNYLQTLIDIREESPSYEITPETFETITRYIFTGSIGEHAIQTMHATVKKLEADPIPSQGDQDTPRILTERAGLTLISRVIRHMLSTLKTPGIKKTEISTNVPWHTWLMAICEGVIHQFLSLAMSTTTQHRIIPSTAFMALHNCPELAAGFDTMLVNMGWLALPLPERPGLGDSPRWERYAFEEVPGTPHLRFWTRRPPTEEEKADEDYFEIPDGFLEKIIVPSQKKSRQK